MLPQITATGRLGADPELKSTPTGRPVVSFRMASDERRRNPNTNEWETTLTVWLGVEAWDRDAEAIAAHLRKGDDVTVIGSLVVREYQRQDGTKGTAVEVKHAKVTKALPRDAAGAAFGQQQPTQQQASAWATPAAPAGDPWATV